MIYKNKQNTDRLQEQVKEWLNTISFSHFLHIQLPKNMWSRDYEMSYQGLRKIYIEFHKNLWRHWDRHPIDFRGAAEDKESKSNHWHYHLLLVAHQIQTEKLEKALDLTRIQLGLDCHTFQLDQITYTPERANGYTTKELIADGLNHCEPDRIIFAADLLNLPVDRFRRWGP